MSRAPGRLLAALHRAWNPLLKATDGPIALALWAETFRRDPSRWLDSDVALFQNPPAKAQPLAAGRRSPSSRPGTGPRPMSWLLDRAKGSAMGWVLALDPIDQSWEPRVVPVNR